MTQAPNPEKKDYCVRALNPDLTPQTGWAHFRVYALKQAMEGFIQPAIGQDSYKVLAKGGRIVIHLEVSGESIGQRIYEVTTVGHTQSVAFQKQKEIVLFLEHSYKMVKREEKHSLDDVNVDDGRSVGNGTDAAPG